MSDARAWLDDPMNVILDPQSARSALLAVLDLHRRGRTLLLRQASVLLYGHRLQREGDR